MIKKLLYLFLTLLIFTASSVFAGDLKVRDGGVDIPEGQSYKINGVDAINTVITDLAEGIVSLFSNPIDDYTIITPVDGKIYCFDNESANGDPCSVDVNGTVDYLAFWIGDSYKAWIDKDGNSLYSSIGNIPYSATVPELTLNDTDGEGSEISDKFSGSISSNMTTTTEDAEVSDVIISYQKSGSKTAAITIDGSANTTIIGTIESIMPQTYTFTTDVDAFTMGTDGTSSIIFLDGDDDSDNDEIDLQDGIVDGQIVTFLVVADCDADDTITIDVEEDSTCTGCPDSGVFVFDDVGDTVTLLWSGSAWFYSSSYEVD